MRDFLTVEQLAERWGLDSIDVHQLVLTRRLPQAFLLSGPARISSTQATSERRLHAMTANGAVQVRLLASTLYPLTGLCAWSLAEVRCVYEFVIDGRNDARLLEQLCVEERTRPYGWTIEFDQESTEVIGQDLFKQASAALRESGLVSIDAMGEFEEAQQIAPESSEERHAPRHLRDTLKQRCRVAAEILWEKDETATVHDLYESDWVRRVACRGKPPTEKTFREWVKDLNPNRSPGRRDR
jgi:hypothetical protein